MGRSPSLATTAFGVFRYPPNGGSAPVTPPAELLFIVSYLFQSPLKLRNTGTGYCVHVAAVAALEEVVGNSGNHSPVVAAKLERRENAVEVASFCQHCAESGICCDTAATDNCFETGVIGGFQ